MNTLKHLPALDGVRGLAVLLVILLHVRLVGMGWIGVSIFFVLSGFLITRILSGQLQSAPPLGRFVGRFYMGRALRIFPLYYAYLILLFICVQLWPSLHNIGDQLPYAAAYVLNFHYIESGQTQINSQLISHFWSLCIELHFYIVWPFFLYFVPRRAQVPALVAMIFLAPLLRYLAANGLSHDESISPGKLIYFFSPAYVDAFAAGALVALRVDRETTGTWALRRWILCLAVAYAVGVWTTRSFGIFSDATAPLALGYPLFMRGDMIYWGYTLINLLAAQLMMIALTQPQQLPLLTSPFLRYTGQISYGLYVLHLPILAVALHLVYQMESAGFSASEALLVLTPIYLLVVYSAAALSYRYLESPFLRLKPGYVPPPPPDEDPVAVRSEPLRRSTVLTSSL